MNANMDQDTEKAWHNWVVFTKFATWSVVVIALIVAGVVALIY